MKLTDLKAPATIPDFIDEDPHNQELYFKFKSRSYLPNDESRLTYFQFLFEILKQIMIKSNSPTTVWKYLQEASISKVEYPDLIEDALYFTRNNYFRYSHLLEPDLGVWDPVMNCCTYCRKEFELLQPFSKPENAKQDDFSNQDFKQLKDLFIEPKDLAHCIECLKQVFPKLLDGNNNYLSDPKGAFVLWFEELRIKPFIKPCKDHTTVANLLNQHFKKLNISDSYFRKTLGPRTENKRIEMKAKLSYLAQKES